MKLVKASLAAAVVATSFSAPVVHAKVTANVGVANFYLWRGVDQSQVTTQANAGSAQVSGGLDYNHDSGFYAGIWTSAASAGTTENDFYAGFAMDLADGVAVDVGAIAYEYPAQPQGEKYGDYSEAYVNLEAMGVAFSVFQSLQTSGQRYYTLGYTYDKVTATVGANTVDGDVNGASNGAGSGDYSHLDVSYAATDELTLTLTQIIDDNGTNDQAGMEVFEDDLLINVAYTKSFDL